MGIPSLMASLAARLRLGAALTMRRRAEQIAKEHARLVERRADAGLARAAWPPRAERMWALELANENDAALAAALTSLSGSLTESSRSEGRGGSEGGSSEGLPVSQGMADEVADELLREAELRLLAAHALEEELDTP